MWKISEILKSKIFVEILVREKIAWCGVKVDTESFPTLCLWLDSDSGSVCWWTMLMGVFNQQMHVFLKKKKKMVW